MKYDCSKVYIACLIIFDDYLPKKLEEKSHKTCKLPLAIAVINVVQKLSILLDSNMAMGLIKKWLKIRYFEHVSDLDKLPV